MDTLLSAKTQSWLSWFLRGVLILGFLILAGRSFELQVIKGSYYRALADENRVRRVLINAPRGRILARGGEVLVGNIELKKRVVFDTENGFKLTNDLSGAKDEEIISLYERNYVLGSKFAHVSGYVSLASPDQIGKIDPECPEKGPVYQDDLVGVSGLEQKYNCILSGTPGEELVEVDTHGIKKRTLAIKPPAVGTDIRTTIDFGLQQELAKEMGTSRGAAIITDKEGQVLAFYSSPSFDPANVSKSLNDLNLPLFNRAISGLFHPGSVFKPIVSIAALSQGVIDKNFLFTDPGVMVVKTLYGNFSYSNWYFSEYGKTEGTIDLTQAIARSTDTFFYKIGEMIGPEKIAEYANKFGLDKPTGIDLPGEMAGLIPTPDWKFKTTGTNWFLGNTYNYSIGQGDIAVTPLALNQAIGAVATGKLCKPYINEKVGVSCKDLNIKKEYLDLVHEGMKKACQEGGTAYTFFDFEQKHNGQTIACKTGTAEVGVDGKPHAWFTLFTPIDNPQIVATFVFERGGQGSEVAGPVARKVIDYYFRNNH